MLQKIYSAPLKMSYTGACVPYGGFETGSSSSSSAQASRHAWCCRAQVQLAAAAGSAVLGLAAAGVGLAGLAGPAELLSPTSALTLCVVCAAAGTGAFQCSSAGPGLPEYCTGHPAACNCQSAHHAVSGICDRRDRHEALCA